LALADIESALKDGREIDHGPSLMYALSIAAKVNMYTGYYAATSKHADEMVIFATQRGVGFWKAFGVVYQNVALALLGNASDAVQKVASAINAYRSMGSTLYLPEYLSYLANAHAQDSQVDDAWRCISEAMASMEASWPTFSRSRAKNRTWSGRGARRPGRLRGDLPGAGDEQAHERRGRSRSNTHALAPSLYPWSNVQLPVWIAVKASSTLPPLGLHQYGTTLS
jgi:hypothetical protein